MLPDPATRYPITVPDGTAHRGRVFLSAAIDHQNIDIGAYSYASDFDPPDNWAPHLAPYLF